MSHSHEDNAKLPSQSSQENPITSAVLQTGGGKVKTIDDDETASSSSSSYYSLTNSIDSEEQKSIDAAFNNPGSVDNLQLKPSTAATNLDNSVAVIGQHASTETQQPPPPTTPTKLAKRKSSTKAEAKNPKFFKFHVV